MDSNASELWYKYNMGNESQYVRCIKQSQEIF